MRKHSGFPYLVCKNTLSERTGFKTCNNMQNSKTEGLSVAQRAGILSRTDRTALSLSYRQFEPPHDKTNKMTVCPAKTQISRPGWSESSLCTKWVAEDPNFLPADSEDSDQTGRMPRLIWVFAGCTCHFVGFVTRWLIWQTYQGYIKHVK